MRHLPGCDLGGHERRPARTCSIARASGGSETGSTGSALFVKTRVKVDLNNKRRHDQRSADPSKSTRSSHARGAGARNAREEISGRGVAGSRSASATTLSASSPRPTRTSAPTMRRTWCLRKPSPSKPTRRERAPDAADERQVYVLEFLHDDGADRAHRGAARFTAGREHFVVVLADEMLRTGPHFIKIEALDAPGHVVAGGVPERQIVGIGFLAHRRRRVERRRASRADSTRTSFGSAAFSAATSASWSSSDRSVRTETS